MIRMETKVSGVSFNSIAYHRFDIDIEDVVTWEEVTKGDEGKYLMFDDGSELYAKIYFLSGKGRVNTSCGTYYIPDIVHCWQPKAPKSSYSEAFKSTVSLDVVPLGRTEKSIVTRISRGEKMATTTPRIDAGVLNVVQEEAVALGYNLEDLNKNLTQEMIKMAMSVKYSPQKLKAIENMKRALANTDVTKLETEITKKKKDLGAIENATFTVSENDTEEASNLLAKIRR